MYFSMNADGEISVHKFTLIFAENSVISSFWCFICNTIISFTHVLLELQHLLKVSRRSHIMADIVVEIIGFNSNSCTNDVDQDFLLLKMNHLHLLAHFQPSFVVRRILRFENVSSVCESGDLVLLEEDIVKHEPYLPYV